MTKLIIVLSVALGAIALDATPASAASCTKQYEQCLNDSWDTEGLTRHLADLECGAEYTGCVAAKLRFW